jgi:amino acid permease
MPPELKRTIGLRFAIVFVIANIIGSGVYKKVAPMTAELNSGILVLLCWIAGGIITLFGALSTAELAAMMPLSGWRIQLPQKNLQQVFCFHLWMGKLYCHQNRNDRLTGICIRTVVASDHQRPGTVAVNVAGKPV